MDNIFSPQDIPGMIEPCEQVMLSRIAKECDLSDPTSTIVEFGTFFGRSTACLASGILQNISLDMATRSIPPLHAFDSFSCANGGGLFSQHVYAFAELAELEHLLFLENNMLDFKEVFDYFLGNHEIPTSSGLPLLRSIRTQLSDIMVSPGRVSVMHIDAPKHYSELEPILVRYFPYFLPKATIVFQDFFYHWSGSIIGALSILIREGMIAPIMSAASSLVCEVRRPISLADIDHVRAEMHIANIPRLISSARQQISTIEIDRKEQFFSRLWLAEAQAHFEQGHFADAGITIKRMLNTHPLTQATLTDMLDLISNGFSIRSSMDRDHPDG